MRKYTRDEIYKLDKNTRKTCERMAATTIADFQPYGRRQIELFFRIQEVKTTPEYINNPEFQQELDKYLDAVQYGKEQTCNQLRKDFNKLGRQI